MLGYLLRRFAAILPTLWGITLVSFVIIQLAPGGPVEQKLQQMRFAGASEDSRGGSLSRSSGTDTVNTEVIEELKRQYGFDRPLHERYLIWVKNLSRLDFGKSFTFDEPVVDVISRRLPVSLLFGLTSFFLAYLVCIPLGVLKAVKNGETFDRVTSALIFAAHATPSFMLGILLIVLFGGGSFFAWFPIGGLVSDRYDELSWGAQLWDRFHHAVMPLACYTLGHFATLTVLMKNSLLEEIKKDYIRTARAKGLGERAVVFRHALRNALIPIATGFGSIVSVFFAGSLLVETLFNLDGMGLLSYKSILSRDYNVVMGILVFESLLYMLGNILSDLLYVVVDPRIDLSGGKTS